MSHPLNQDIDFKILFQNISVTIETYGAKQYKTGTCVGIPVKTQDQRKTPYLISFL